MRAPPSLASLAVLLSASACGLSESRTDPGSEAFERDHFERLPLGPLTAPWTVARGHFEVVEDSSAGDGLRVVDQLAESDTKEFNLALDESGRWADADVSVRLLALAGDDDRGGGLVWRAIDARNYYVARWNPLEKNLRAYKVVGGTRTQLASVEVVAEEGWHLLTVRFEGERATVSFDAAALLDVRDATFREPGHVGLWTKADARTRFNGFRCSKEFP